MDAYNFYLATLRYILNANPADKATWCDIFKYIPCLRQMLSCCVCGSIMCRPHGPTHGVCLHHVCRECMGGRMKLKPSCSWCKDHDHFVENTKLRVLILCFKRLCAYVSNSNLGAEISKASINGYGIEAEKTMRVLEEADRYQDDYVLTPAPTELPTISKSSSGGLKSSQLRMMPASKTVASGKAKICKRKRGRPKTMSDLQMKSSKNKINITEHVKKLKKKAINSQTKKSINKISLMKTHPNRKLVKNSRRKKSLPINTDLLISQRPHRARLGNCSVGQLWRETFLEKTQPESYPDSGIEVGNSSDHDHYSQPPPLTRHVPEAAGNKVDPIRIDKRFNRSNDINQKGELSANDVTDSTFESHKPRLTLTISKKRLQKFSRRGRNQPPSVSSHKTRDNATTKARQMNFRLPNSSPGIKKNSNRLGSTQSGKQQTYICRCARFKQPNQLTCFGQKCPCYSDHRACVDCLCNGCRNPLKPSDSAPPLMHIVKDSDSLDASFDRSMPRLSPIPKL